MGNLVNYSTSLHQATKREYIKRMVDDKINCMLKAKEYEFDYWDGSRRYGYGGYKFIPGRWKPVAELLIKNYKLTNDSSVLDVGCGRGEYSEDPIPLRKNLRVLQGKAGKVIGIDVDQHAQTNPFIDEFHLIQSDSWPIESNSIDLIVCDNVLEHINNPEKLANWISLKDKDVDLIGTKVRPVPLNHHLYYNEKILYRSQFFNQKSNYKN